MLRQIRDWYKVFFCIDSVLELARLIAVIAVGTVMIFVLLVRRDFGPVVPVLGEILRAVAVLGFVAWIYHDARKALRTIRQQRQNKQRKRKTDTYLSRHDEHSS